MAELLMITGDRMLAEGKRGAFYNTLEEFHKYWDRIDIITPPVNTKHKTQNITYFNNVFIHSSPRPLIMQPWFILKKGKEIYKQHKFNVMTVHEYPPFYNGIGARFLHDKIKVPYILEIHHIPGYPKAGNFKESLYKNFLKFFIKWDSSRVKALRVVNKEQVPEFLIKSGISKKKIIYIPSMYVDLNIFRPMNLDKKYDLIFVGRLTRNKGINLFLEAVNRLKVKTIIVGEGPLKENLKLKIENLKLKDKVFLYGWAKDSQEIAKLINQSKILVMPSYNEGGPRVVPEAMACGVPILATPVGIVPDIIKDKESGRITSWDSSDIADKAGELLNNEFEYNKYSQMGIEIAKQFERKQAIQNYANKLKSFIS